MARGTAPFTSQDVLAMTTKFCPEAKSEDVVTTLWRNTCQYVAARLLESKATQIPRVGTWTYDHNGDLLCAFASDFTRAAGLVPPPSKQVSGSIQTAPVNIVAVSGMTMPPSSKSLVQDLYKAIARALWELGASGRGMQLDMRPLGQLVASPASSGAHLSFQFDREFVAQAKAAKLAPERGRQFNDVPVDTHPASVAGTGSFSPRKPGAPAAPAARAQNGSPRAPGAGGSSPRAPARPVSPRAPRVSAAGAGARAPGGGAPVSPRAGGAAVAGSSAGGARRPSATGHGIDPRRGGAAPESKNNGPTVTAGRTAGPAATGSTPARAGRAEEAKSNRPKFTDDKFPANGNSLCHDWARGNQSWRRYTWRRATEFMGTRPVLYHSIEPSDINQGALADCYYLCALAVLAEFPDRVKRLFLEADPERGYYKVRFYANGEPTDIVVDDYFPCNPDTGMPAFSTSKGDNEVWVLVLEKAWAKFHGSYQVIEGGTVAEVLTALTGAPCDVYEADGLPTEKRRELFEKVLEADQKNFLIAGAVPDIAGVDLERTVGLIEEHAYSFMSAFQLSNGTKLVKLRNPWGAVEWQGDWSDDSPLWTPALKSQLGWTDEDDGTFFMSWEDIIKYFCTFTVVHVNDAYSLQYTTLPRVMPGQPVAVEFTVPEHCAGSMALFQPSVRSQIISQHGYALGSLQLEVYALDPHPTLVEDTVPMAWRWVFEDVEFPPGRYMAVAQITVPRPRNVNLVFYADRRVKFGQVSTDSAKIERVVAAAYARKAMEEGKKMDFGGLPGMYGWSCKTNTGACLVYRNESNKTLNERLTCTLDNCRIVGTEAAKVDVRLAPGTNKTVICRVMRAGDAWNFNFSRSIAFQ